MKDQHEKIEGYRDLSQAEIDAMNELKQMGKNVAEVIDGLTNHPNVMPDQRHLAIARTHFEIAFMFAIKSVAKPTTPF